MSFNCHGINTANNSAISTALSHLVYKGGEHWNTWALWLIRNIMLWGIIATICRYHRCSHGTSIMRKIKDCPSKVTEFASLGVVRSSTTGNPLRQDQTSHHETNWNSFLLERLNDYLGLDKRWIISLAHVYQQPNFRDLRAHSAWQLTSCEKRTKSSLSIYCPSALAH